tara:strand:- start:383 stop:997 length:615 start_codon:yes stop_codon:yes gene_type:complete
MIYLVAGLIIGFFVALPVGAAAVMCISRTIQFGLSTGLLTGFGVALADLFYGILAVFGLFAISGETLESQPVLRLAGAFCIMFLGLRMMSKIDMQTNQNIDHENAIKDIVTGFLVTISNPFTIIAFVAALSYVNFLMEEISYIGSILIIFGIFSGSFIWWLILCSISINFKERLTPKFIQKINLISGGLIFIFGILLVISIKEI